MPSAMTAVEQAARLKRWALEEGFQRAGVATLGPVRQGDVFLRWLGRGDQAAMGYLEGRQEVRLDPRRVFEGARSAVCVALQYHPSTAAEEEVTGDLWPRVARYARGRDYHNVMTKRLRKLARRVEEAFPGTRTKPYVDTGPVLERDLAAAAGLGVAGKNTMLLHPEAGSYFLLGELFTSLDLAPDPPIADLCGSCSMCLEACPTDALPEPYRLDANKCISYWTIEHRGGIPPEMRPQLGDWVFGCDICQEVCPHNDRPLVRGDEAFDLPTERIALDLAALLDLDEKEYQRLFQGSPMKRSRRQGLRRNACVAMGNLAHRSYVTPLGRALGDPDPLIRSHAAWSLGRIGGPEAAAKLTAALASEADSEVSEMLEIALAGTRRSGRDANSQLP